jgi:nucleoside-specific outer membrane channel protein Tsx
MSFTPIRTLCGTIVAVLILGIAVMLTIAIVPDASAGSAAWQSTNFQYLYGSGFKLGAKERSTITVEHANAWKYGDNFFFLDATDPETNRSGSSTALYAELSPRFSLSKITNSNLSFPLVKDVLVATTLEMGQGFHNYLYGVGLSLDLPKFAFADLNMYVRNDPKQYGVTYQITPCWALPFTIGPAKMLFEGFVDIAGAEGSSEFNIDAQPRLLLDVGNFWGAPDSLFAGTEVIYWHNKFGVKDVKETAPQAMVKWVF